MAATATWSWQRRRRGMGLLFGRGMLPTFFADGLLDGRRLAHLRAASGQVFIQGRIMGRREPAATTNGVGSVCTAGKGRDRFLDGDVSSPSLTFVFERTRPQEYLEATPEKFSELCPDVCLEPGPRSVQVASCWFPGKWARPHPWLIQ
eukprot:CAMPEP_0172724470 /NCGR_PEP_ID=MMETSP1074-20121228/86059_1 /TAXON_ID=2916 /ORGANISM="Ceratium fusus, Strain PA161109" /LENGTH=147 /DNA_ID=CAMNT_0013550957 /DNA_START=77 /DNA_END=519 /DNA_ORIENTATION=+